MDAVGKESTNLVRRIRKYLEGRKKTQTNVYFVSGMCYNCSVFDKLKLPQGYVKKYIEWHVPHPGETLEEYTRTMAKEIDISIPFVLVGYSFGGVIIQEMNKFLSPIKSILISSFKGEEEIPILFRAAKRINVSERIPMRVYASTDFMTEAFNRFVYHMSTAELATMMTFIDPVYIKWAIRHITDWVPQDKYKHLYHIHGTQDQIFPYELIQDAFPVEEGDHLMVMKKADMVSSIMSSILLMKERK